MTIEDIERVHYYERQYLSAADFQAEQAYHRDMRRRHSIAHHTIGVVVGMELLKKTEGGALAYYMLPGKAIDGFGREIIVQAPYKLDAALFDRFNTLAHRQIWIGYEETDAMPPGFGFDVCDVDNTNRRTVETWRIVVDPGTNIRDDVIVDGKPTGPPPPVNPDDLTIPADLSTPYQELPDDRLTDPLWLIRLGTVQWDGVTKQFADTTDDRLNEERSYVGSVAADLLAPAGALRIRPRAAFTDVDAQDFADVEGRLAVDGRLTARADVHVDGGKVRMNYTGGDTDTVDMWAQRQRGPADVGHIFRLHIGDAAEETHKLTIGPGDGAEEKAVLAVRADDVVEVLTGTLRFGAQVRQMIDLWTTTGDPGKAEYGIGIQSGTLYQRSNSQFCWFRGGEHEDAASTPGAGGVMQLRLDHSGRLHFEETNPKQALNLQGTAWGIGTQPTTLYLRSPGGFAWYRGGLESPTNNDAGGGSVAMKLSSSNTLTVFGDANATGDMVVGQGGNATLRVRHIEGKHFASDAEDHLYLNWSSGRDVHVGQVGATPLSDLIVSGNLTIHGADDRAFRVRSYERAVKNAGAEPATWSVNVSGDFTRVFEAYAVLSGFSVWDNSTTFQNWAHASTADAIVQHCYVRVTSFSDTQVLGECFCQESLETNEEDNTVLFNVVVFGRKT